VNTRGTSKALFRAEEGGIIWKIKRFPGQMESSLQASIELLSNTNKPWERPPITMQFTIHGHAASGLLIRYLKVQEKSGYRPFKWVRYITSAGEYEKRI